MLRKRMGLPILKAACTPKIPSKQGISMCFTVFLATDSPTDLLHDGQGLPARLAEPDEARAAKLPYPYVRTAGDKEGCACRFNFYGPLITAATRFGTTAVSAPEKNGEETAQEQRETLYLLDVVRRLVRNGAKVQVACVWSGNWPQLREPAVEVALHTLNPYAFALFENVRFESAE